MKHVKKLLLGVVAGWLGLSGSTTLAALLPPGPLAVPADPTVTVSGTLYAPVLTGTTIGPLTATVTQYVIVDSITSKLDFVYQVHPTSGLIERITVTGFGSSIVDAGYTTAINDPTLITSPAGAVAPTTMDRVTADTVGFSFPAPFVIPQGGNSVFLVVKTDAVNADRSGFLSVIDGATGFISVFAPAAVPLPSSVSGGMGLFVLLGVGRVLKRRSQLA